MEVSRIALFTAFEDAVSADRIYGLGRRANSYSYASAGCQRIYTGIYCGQGSRIGAGCRAVDCRGRASTGYTHAARRVICPRCAADGTSGH